MLIITIILSIALIFEYAYTIIYVSEKSYDTNSNYVMGRAILVAIVLVCLWSHYSARMDEIKLIDEYKKGCPQYEMVTEPMYKLKN